MKCEHEGCPHEATVAPKVNVPATGWAIDLHQPLAVLFAFKVCRDHFEEFKQQFTWHGNDPLRRAIELAARACHKAAPDFDRVFVSSVKLASDEFAQFERIRQERK